MGIWNRIRVHRHDIVPITGGVKSTLNIRYEVRNIVSSTREFQYGILNLVSDTVDLLYGIRNLISDTLELRYPIKGAVLNTLQLVYSVIAPSITASFKQAKHLGSELETIDEMPAIPKTAIISSTGFHIDAELTVPESTTFNLQSGLLVPNAIPIHASSESLMKKEYVGSISASLKVSNEILVKIESKFKSTQPIGIMKAEISFAPIYRIIQNNLILLQKSKETFTIEEDVKYWINSEDIFHFKHQSVVVGLVTYDSDKSELNIFLNGTRYTYFDVPHRVYDQFEGSPSKGAAFSRLIRDQYSFKKN